MPTKNTTIEELPKLPTKPIAAEQKPLLPAKITTKEKLPKKSQLFIVSKKRQKRPDEVFLSSEKKEKITSKSPKPTPKKSILPAFLVISIICIMPTFLCCLRCQKKNQPAPPAMLIITQTSNLKSRDITPEKKAWNRLSALAEKSPPPIKNKTKMSLTPTPVQNITVPFEPEFTSGSNNFMPAFDEKKMDISE